MTIKLVAISWMRWIVDGPGAVLATSACVLVVTLADTLCSYQWLAVLGWLQESRRQRLLSRDWQWQQRCACGENRWWLHTKGGLFKLSWSVGYAATGQINLFAGWHSCFGDVREMGWDWWIGRLINLIEILCAKERAVGLWGNDVEWPHKKEKHVENHMLWSREWPGANCPKILYIFLWSHKNNRAIP